MALAGATPAPGYSGTGDLTVTGRGPPADRWSRPWSRGRPRGEPAGGNGGCPGRLGWCGYPTRNPAWGRLSLADDAGGSRWPALHYPRGVAVRPPRDRPSPHVAHRAPVADGHAAGGPREPRRGRNTAWRLPLPPTRFTAVGRQRYGPAGVPGAAGVRRLARRGDRYGGGRPDYNSTD
jgi:hypothetical protein